jgi:hypothetical protein
MLGYAIIRRNGRYKIRPVRATGLDENGRPILPGPVALRPKAFLTVKEAKAYVAEQQTRKTP